MLYSFIFEFIKTNYIKYIFYYISLLYIPLSKVGMPHLYGKLISNLKDKNINISIKYFIILILLWFFIQLVVIFSHYLRSLILPLFSSFIRNKMVDEIINRYKINYEEIELGKTITKIIKAPWLVEDIFYMNEDFIYRNIFILLSSFGYLFYYNKTLGIVFILCIGITLLICYFFLKNCKKYTNISEDIYDNTHEEIEDTLSNLMSIYTSKKTEFEKNRIKKHSEDVYNSEKNIMKCNNTYRLYFSAVFLIIFLFLNLYSFYLFRKKEIKLDILIAIIIINYSLLSTFIDIYYDTKKFMDIRGRIQVFNEYIKSLPNSSNDNKINLDNTDNITIRFRNINFYYTPDKYILKNLNLTINNNEIIGLVGHIGSGKSTIAKLIIRLAQYKSGSIKINNIEINKLNIDSLRDNITYIPQHPKLFNRTLFNNIVYGSNKKIDEKEIYKILDKLDLKDTTNKFKKMMFKKVGKNGSKLSGGQRQIVWLIRSILKNSKVIILDEPTSSLDNNSKEQVIKFIQKFSKNKLLILITHDKSLLKYVNRTITLKNGEILSDIKKNDTINLNNTSDTSDSSDSNHKPRFVTKPTFLF